MARRLKPAKGSAAKGPSGGKAGRKSSRPSSQAVRPVPGHEPGTMPSREAIRRFVAEASGRVGKREIAKAFGLGAADKLHLRDLLKDMASEGNLAPAGHKRFMPAGGSMLPHAKGSSHLPEVAVILITGTDRDGDAVGRPAEWPREAGPPPSVLMHPEPRGRPALAPGEKVLARLRPIGHGRYEGRTIKRLGGDTPRPILGVYRLSEPVTLVPRSTRTSHAARQMLARQNASTAQPEGRVVPTDRRSKAEWLVPAGEEGGAEPGDIVRAMPLPHTGYGLKPARIIEKLGKIGDARSVSLICIETHDIPQIFPDEALSEARKARAVPLEKREDLRDIPLITIDGEDARDFDDAVFAERAENDGFRLIVAIADVAHYVRPGSALDREAFKRGNSCYFPDRVVPMLPEALSNGWCSLRPDEDRGCLFVEMMINAGGGKIRHRFGRGLMRSTARRTYEEVQQAHEAGDETLDALYGAYHALIKARTARGTLDLDLPERKVILNEAGSVDAIIPRPRLDSHRLIEEFMVLANVAAAEELERLHRPCMYRVHAPPSDEKTEALRGFLDSFGISLPPAGQIHPRDLDHILKQVAGTEHAALINETMLRSQSQAEYNPDNIGHFGLALSRYAHFTSPIRRYADLLVHRALIAGLKLGVGSLEDDEASRFVDIAEHITATERRAAMAERDAIDRYLAAFMADRVGARFAARISGVTRFGLFITVEENGASGIVPISSLPDDFWIHDEREQALIGRNSRAVWRLAQSVTVRLAEATPITGGLVFNLLPGASSSASSRPDSTDRTNTQDRFSSRKRGSPGRSRR
ncbi:ribonuclease R [Granulibacter bethesdensis]|uniref:Ribonuclease R n=1 Tax=Granulibacter bethesdensis (strain ATCC BAA-1260 / CGDNIH1) TaxID=391165 RepID=Q0BU01_GRABC|nr:Ribonuclease R [Granulibacter bethesdensis CGDNIH1]APH51508.1 Ribonuclease R [Granulibacter bethesdensis]APH64201.1 Ribonuclease R [Granulibacter bethesdensis]